MNNRKYLYEEYTSNKFEKFNLEDPIVFYTDDDYVWTDMEAFRLAILEYLTYDEFGEEKEESLDYYNSLSDEDLASSNVSYGKFKYYKSFYEYLMETINDYMYSNEDCPLVDYKEIYSDEEGLVIPLENKLSENDVDEILDILPWKYFKVSAKAGNDFVRADVDKLYLNQNSIVD